jgi:hypothetical protein
MTHKLTALLLSLFISVVFSGFNYPSAPNGLHFTDFQVKSIQAKEVRLKAITDNSGIRQSTDIVCTIGIDSIYFEVLVLPNDRNIDLKYRASIKLK